MSEKKQKKETIKQPKSIKQEITPVVTTVLPDVLVTEEKKKQPAVIRPTVVTWGFLSPYDVLVGDEIIAHFRHREDAYRAAYKHNEERGLSTDIKTVY